LHLTENNGGRFRPAFARMLDLRYHWLRALAEARSAAALRRILREGRRFRSKRRSGARALVKDPLALFSAEWLSANFGMRMVILIRHPAAFASSLKRLDWKFPFCELLAQPELMRNHLSSFEETIRRFDEQEQDIVDQAALVWKITHHVIDHYRETHPDWIFLRNEDLSSAALERFGALAVKLAIPWSETLRKRAREYSDPSNPVDAPEGVVSHLKRDSRSNIDAWKRQLSLEEIRRIRECVGEVAARFYSDREW
jgi:hypothetical protein